MTAAVSAAAPSKALHVSLWIVQGLLGVAFMMSGAFKLFGDLDELAKAAVWIQTTGTAVARFAGAVELLGGIGLIVPSAARILPKLTPIAASGLVVVMATAMAIHLFRGDELTFVPVNIVLGGLAAFVAWGRFRGAPIPAR